MPVGILTLELFLPGCTSLKEKRGKLKPLLTHLNRQFNLSAAEIGHLDSWQQTRIACALISNDPVHIRRALEQVTAETEQRWPEIEVCLYHIEII